jgi:hypothetical protein
LVESTDKETPDTMRTVAHSLFHLGFAAHSPPQAPTLSTTQLPVTQDPGPTPSPLCLHVLSFLLEYPSFSSEPNSRIAFSDHPEWPSTQLALNSLSSCLYLLSVEITGVHHHTGSLPAFMIVLPVWSWLLCSVLMSPEAGVP